MPKNLCLRTVVLKKTPQSPSGSKEIKPVNLKGDRPWIFTGRTHAAAEAPVLWSRDVNRRLIGKSLMLGKTECRRRRGHQRMRWMDRITNAMNINLGKLQEMMRERESCCAAVHRITKSQTWLGNWTTTATYIKAHFLNFSYGWSSKISMASVL